MRLYIYWVYLAQNVLYYLNLRIYVFHQLRKILRQYLVEYLFSPPPPASLTISFILLVS